MLKFKINALIYALQELRYEKGMFRENYRNKLMSQLVRNTHLHAEVIYEVFRKVPKTELERYLNEERG